MLGNRIVSRIQDAAFVFCLACGIALAATVPAFAGTATANFTVSATVLASCQVNAANLAFGNYTPGSATPVTASSTINVTCTTGTGYTVALDGGTVSNAMTARNMKNTTNDLLSYGLYTSSACITIWGDGTGGTLTDIGLGNGTAQSYTVYGRIPAGQYAPAASYSDQIGVTVSY